MNNASAIIGRIQKILAVSGLAIVLTVSSASTVHAIESGGVGGKPANPRADNPRSQSIFVYDLKPGSKVEDAVQVVNNTNERKTIEVYPVDSQVSSGGAFACAQKADVPADVGKWITVTGSPVEIESKGKALVPFTVNVPDNANVGENNACLAIQPVQADAKSTGNGIVLNFRSAIRVVVTVPGKITKALAVTGVKVTEKNDKLVISPSLKNTGNVSLDTDVEVTLEGMFGKVAKDGGTFPVLRGQQSDLNFNADKPFWGGWYQAKTVARYVSNTSTPFGAKAEPDKSVTSSQTVFVAPKPAASAILAAVVLAVVAAIALLVRARIIRRRHEQSAESFTIEEGDDLQTLARENGVSWKVIARMNDLKPPYTIHPGQKLRIPVKQITSSKKRPKE